MIRNVLTFCFFGIVLVASLSDQQCGEECITATSSCCADEKANTSVVTTATETNNTSSKALSYTCFDDMSWSIRSDKISDRLDKQKQTIYNEFLQKCRERSGYQAFQNCDHQENYRRMMNVDQTQSVRNYTQTGFKKLRAPETVVRLLDDFWKTNRHLNTTEWKRSSTYHNNWESPLQILKLGDTALSGGGLRLKAQISNAARDLMEDWTGQQLAMTSVYGIRIYHDGAILAPHVDRLPLVVSAIVNVAQDVEEDWSLEVYDHKGVAHNITMEPGEMVLYESHSVIHGRPFPLKGKYYANVFIHFEPLGPIGEDPSPHQIKDKMDLPPYLLPNSPWSNQYQKENPKGWPLVNNPIEVIKRGDLHTLKYLAKAMPSLVHDTVDNQMWRPIHEAVRQGYLDIVQYLIEQEGVNIHAVCRVGGGMTPLAVSREFHGVDHDMSRYLESHGALLNWKDDPVKAGIMDLLRPDL